MREALMALVNPNEAHCSATAANACCRPVQNPVFGHRRTQMLRAKLTDSLILLSGWLVSVDPAAAAHDLENFMSLPDTVLYARAAYYGGLEDTENNMKKVGNGQKLRLRISQEDALRINFVRDIYDAFRCLASTGEVQIYLFRNMVGSKHPPHYDHFFSKPRAAYKQRFVLSWGGKVRFHLKSQATEEILYSAGYVIDTDLGSKPYQHSVPAVEREGVSIVVSLRRASISFDDIRNNFVHRPVYIPVKPLRPDMPVRLEQTSRMYTEERHLDPGSEATTDATFRMTKPATAKVNVAKHGSRAAAATLLHCSQRGVTGALFRAM